MLQQYMDGTIEVSLLSYGFGGWHQRTEMTPAHIDDLGVAQEMALTHRDGSRDGLGGSSGDSTTTGDGTCDGNNHKYKPTKYQ